MRAGLSPRSVAAGPRALFLCIVSVRIGGAVPRRHSFDGLYRSTSDAVLDAMDRYPDLRSASAKVGGKLR